MNNCGKRIVEKMIERNWDIRKLSEESGVSRSALYHYIRGDTTPNAYLLECLANAFGVTMDWLWGKNKEGNNAARFCTDGERREK